MFAEAAESYDKSLKIDPQNKVVKEAQKKAVAQLAVLEDKKGAEIKQDVEK
jgi:hypothetical protein